MYFSKMAKRHTSHAAQIKNIGIEMRFGKAAEESYPLDVGLK
jgi:hypothetical protein